MKFSNAMSLLGQIRETLSLALIPTIKAIFTEPILLVKPGEISKIFMSHVWVPFSDGMDENERVVKTALIEPHAEGVVLDIGAGHGHTAQYLNPSRVSRYIALEPNTHMHHHIRARAHKAGFFESDGRLIILGCGAEETHIILDSLRDGNGIIQPVDTLISIFTLCSVPNQEKTIRGLVCDVLKPGGQLLYYEHVRSPRADVVWWQGFWTPIWRRVFGGCRLDRPTERIIAQVMIDDNERGSGETSVWSTLNQWGPEAENQDDLFCRVQGRLIKA